MPMPELNVHEILKKQKPFKPNIEDVIPEYLESDEKNNALDIVAYLRKSKIKPAWAVANGWKAIYKGKSIYFIYLPSRASGEKDWKWRTKKASEMTEWEHSWVFIADLKNINEYADVIINEGWQNLIWENMCYCQICNNGCNPGVSKEILGKNLTGLCVSGTYAGRLFVLFVNPDEKTIGIIKRLLELEKQSREAYAKKK